MNIPKDIPVAEYTFGVCHYGHKEPYRTGTVKTDSMQEARTLAFKSLKPTLIERIVYVKTEPNPDYLEYRNESTNE